MALESLISAESSARGPTEARAEQSGFIQKHTKRSRRKRWKSQWHGEGGKGARKSEKEEVGRSMIEDELEELQIGIGHEEVSSNEEEEMRGEQVVRRAGSSEETGSAHRKPGKSEDSQTMGHMEDAEAGENSGRKALATRKRNQEALSAGGEDLPTVLHQGKGVRISEGSTSKESLFEAPRKGTRAESISRSFSWCSLELQGARSKRRKV